MLNSSIHKSFSLFRGKIPASTIQILFSPNKQLKINNLHTTRQFFVFLSKSRDRTPLPKKSNPILSSSSFLVPTKSTQIKNQQIFNVEFRRFYNRGYYNYGNKSNWRDYINRFNDMNPNRILWTIVGINIGVFVLWNTYGQVPEGRRMMFNNFTVSWNNIRNGRIWTILTTNFSQKDFFHLLFNMLGLYFMGTTMLGVLGNLGFVYVYMMSGISSSLLHVTYENYIRPKLLEKDTTYRRRLANRETPALGASGSVMGLLVLFGLTFPREIIYLNFFLPVPAILLAGGYVAYDLWGAMIAPRDRISHAGHLGGAVFGIAFWASRLRRRF